MLVLHLHVRELGLRDIWDEELRAGTIHPSNHLFRKSLLQLDAGCLRDPWSMLGPVVSEHQGSTTPRPLFTPASPCMRLFTQRLVDNR